MVKQNKKITTGLNQKRDKKNKNTSNNIVSIKVKMGKRGNYHTGNLDNRLIRGVHKLVMYRKKIDVIDSKISKLLFDRYKLVKSIGKYKIDNNLPIINLNREKQVINNVVREYKDNKIKKYINNIYLNIIRISRSIEN